MDKLIRWVKKYHLNVIEKTNPIMGLSIFDPMFLQCWDFSVVASSFLKNMIHWNRKTWLTFDSLIKVVQTRNSTIFICDGTTKFSAAIASSCHSKIIWCSRNVHILSISKNNIEQYFFRKTIKMFYLNTYLTHFVISCFLWESIHHKFTTTIWATGGLLVWDL